jgi:hypothetical protein
MFIINTIFGLWMILCHKLEFNILKVIEVEGRGVVSSIYTFFET